MAAARRRETEILDGDTVSPRIRSRSMRDVSRSNALLGGRRAATRAVAELADRHALVLDVGTGLGDVAAALATGLGARVVGMDTRRELLVEARAAGRVAHAVCADALALPFRDGAVDVVLCSQVLHHFDDARAARLVHEADRVARRGVAVADLRRSRVAAAGFWVASWLLRFHAVTRHDGTLSVLKGFTAPELSAIVARGAGAAARVERRAGFRLTATWRSAHAAGAAAGAPHALGAMPGSSRMTTIDERMVRAPLERIFALAAQVERWPDHLAHYRFVRFHERTADGGGVVEMSANRQFGPAAWPTWWTSLMSVRHPAAHDGPPVVRYRHVRGITTGMEVEWQFEPGTDGTRVRIVHRWNGPRVPVIGGWAAALIIGPIFVHGIASRTLAGLARAAESSEGLSAHSR